MMSDVSSPILASFLWGSAIVVRHSSFIFFFVWVCCLFALSSFPGFKLGFFPCVVWIVLYCADIHIPMSIVLILYLKYLINNKFNFRFYIGFVLFSSSFR